MLIDTSMTQKHKIKLKNTRLGTYDSKHAKQTQNNTILANRLKTDSRNDFGRI